MKQTSPAPSKDAKTSPCLIHAQIDAIAKRQSARFLDRLRQAGNSTPVLERDFMRSVRFLCDDVKAAIHEQSPEAHNARKPQD